MLCKICASATSPQETARILGKYDVRLYHCPACGFVQTEDPYWLDEAYAEPFMKNDIGLVRRNLDLSTAAAPLISCLFDRKARFLDYGGGNGLFVRLMRDKGYDFYWHDKYAKNIFAAGFAAGERRGFELVTAFELFEHLPNPSETVREMLEYSENILFSTRLVPSPRPRAGEWWYYALDGGQHVSFYQAGSLGFLAKQLGLRLCTNGVSLHLLSRRRFSNAIFSLLSRVRVARILDALIKRKSLLGDDYFRLTGLRPE